MLVQRFSSQFTLEHLLQVILIILMLEVEAVLAVHEAVDVEVLLDVECLYNLLVPPNSVVEAVAVFTHNTKSALLLCVRGHSVYL